MRYGRNRMVKKLLIALALMLPSYGVTAFPTSVSAYVRGEVTSTYGSYGTTIPNATPITVSGTGSWSISLGGDLSTACGAAYGYCFNIVTSVSNNCAGALPTGSGATTLYLCWANLAPFTISVGTHTGTVTIGSTTINVTLVVYAPNPWWSFSYPTGYPSGCVTTDSFPQADTCTIPDERPTSTAFSIPSVAGSYTDPTFGHVVSRVTDPSQTIQYGALSAFSATSKYVLTTTISGAGIGQVNVYNRATGALAYSALPGLTIDYASWDPSDDEKLWYMSGGTIKYRTLNTGTVTTAADYTSSSGSRPAMSAITMGGTVDITDDGWWSFSNNDTTLCAVNLNGLTTGNQESKTFCADITSYSISIDYPPITQVDSGSGKRYVLTISAPRQLVFSVGASSLTYEYDALIQGEPHGDVGQDASGNQFFLYLFEPPGDGSNAYVVSVGLSHGADMNQPVEGGGGLAFLYPLKPAAQTDAHLGCSWTTYRCVVTPYGNSGGITAKLISAVSPATPCQITSAGHGYTTGDSILIGGSAGITDINGVWTITVTNANNYTLNGHTCGITYTPNSANSVLNVSTASDSPNRQESDVLLFDASVVRRSIIHRAKIYDNGSTLLGYYATPRASISRDGSWVSYESNYGIPEQPSAWVYSTAIPAAPTGGSGIKGNVTIKLPLVLR